MRDSFQEWIRGDLDRLRSLDRFRRLDADAHSEGLTDFSSNDYLGFAGHPRLKRAMQQATDRWGCGAGASPLVTGYTDVHQKLEETIAQWMDREAALLFGSGYLANLGVLGTLADKNTLVFADRKVHASLLDGIRLSGAKLFRYQSGDAGSLERMLRRQAENKVRKIVLTESVFSMDGHLAPLEEIAALAREHADLWIVDEAHAIGIFGRHGSGCCSALSADLGPDLLIGTGGKALGCYGAFVACDGIMRNYLINRCRSLIYSTALPAPIAATLTEAIRMLGEQNPENALGLELQRTSLSFRKKLRRVGFDLPLAPTPIVPILVGGDRPTLALAETLRKEGFLTVAIRPPTVPEGTSRLRLSLSHRHTEEQRNRLVETLARHWRR